MTVEAPATPAAPAPSNEPAAFVMPDKFKGKTAEDIAKAYTELEKVRTPSQPAEGDKPPTLKIDPSATPAMVKSVDDVLSKVGLKADDVAKQFGENGSLTPEQYKAFEKQGYGQEVVDAFMRGQQAHGESIRERAASLRTEVYNMAGGEEQFGNMASWAAGNCTKDELASYNAMVEGPKATPDSIRMAGQWLVARYQGANGGAASASSPRTSATSPGGTTPFRSQQEVTAAMNDPRYRPTLSTGVRNPKHDPNYEKQVDARLAMTN